MKIFNLIQVRHILDAYKNTQLSSALAYQVTKFLMKSQTEEEFYYSRLRALFNEYAEKNEDGSFVMTDDGQGIKIKQDLLEKFQVAYEELENTEVEAPAIKFALSAITKELNSITVNQMMALMEFIDEEK
jgi:hypothetical protein